MLEQGAMPTKCRFWFFLVFKLFFAVGVPEKICTVHSRTNVHMGSSFNIYCIFKKDCEKLIYQDEVPINCSSVNSSVAVISLVNLNRRTTITCRCNNHLEPCGIDIIPGYPPEAPQNLTCVQEGESGKVKCTWTMGLDTDLRTTSHLWVQGTNSASYPSESHGRTRSVSFPILDNQTQLSVWVNATNSLGSIASHVLSFYLRDIVMPSPPNITNVECSSRQCHLHADRAESNRLVEIQYGVDVEKQNTIFFNHPRSWTIPALSPYTQYTFKVRWKLNSTAGLWSEWSVIKHVTNEEAPMTMLDAWYIEQTTQTGIQQLFWKNLNKSEARGDILYYNVSVWDNGKKNNISLGPTRRHLNVLCSLCTVSIFAINSKGRSPPRVIKIQPIPLLQFKVSHVCVNNHSVALSWRAHANTVTEYLVEWYPVGRKQQIQWIRVKHHLKTVNITGLKPVECYEGAVVYLHPSGMERAVFGGISTWQTAPQHSPDCITRVMNGNVQINWTEVPHAKRGGCLKKYSIYLEDLKGKIQNYSVLHPQREYTIRDLTLGQRYKLWVSAWTEAGESPKGSEVQFIMNHSEHQLVEAPVFGVLAVGCALFFTCLILLCACQFPSVHRRFSQCCHCLMPSIVPDPANSKWAKECASEKGEMKLQLHLSDSSVSEDEPDTVEVQEVPQEQPLPAAGALSSGRDLDIQDQELCAPSGAPLQSNITSSYLKSFSQESSFSNTTQSTDITVDYISTHGVMSEEDNNDEEAETMEMLDFFPCPQSPFLEPLISIGGTLTLDAVKIDCSDFIDCT